MSELILRGGTVIDGTGRPGQKNDILVRDGVIAEIGNLSGRKASREIDAEGSVVSPGFIDVHTHICLLYTSPSPRDLSTSRMPSSA